MSRIVLVLKVWNPAGVLLSLVSLGFVAAAPSSHATVVVHRLPNGGIQPRAAVDRNGTVHVVYFTGEPAHGDASYMRSRDGVTFSDPIPVNSTLGTVIAVGTVRGAQVAVGRNGRVHVAWNGAHQIAPRQTPMFYARLNDVGTAFEPQQNVMQHTDNIDGGGAVAADRDGRVYVVWHANERGGQQEGERRVWVARSNDDGRSFDRERAVFGEATGACGCCGLGAFADTHGSLFVLFRSAFEVVHRDMYLLASSDHAQSFAETKVDEWNVGACVMSTQAFAEGPSGVYTAWETQGQVYMGRIDTSTGKLVRAIAAPGDDRTRKHPVLAVNSNGDVLFAWTEGTSWSRGGSAAWQVFNAAGEPVGPSGHADGVPVWGLVAAYVQSGGFALTY